MKKITLGIIVILIMCCIPYVLTTGKSVGGDNIGNVGRVIIVICLISFTCQLLFNKKAREVRKARYGSSNFFVALFKKENKNEKS